MTDASRTGTIADGASLTLAVGLRYLRAERRNHFISFISMMSGLGIILGVAALIVTLSVMNGFGTELRARILGVISHITVSDEFKGLHDWRGLENMLGRHGVRASAPYVTGEAMIFRGQMAHGIMVRGVSAEHEARVSSVASMMTAGRFDSLKTPGTVIIGKALADKLGVSVGKPLVLVAQNPDKLHGAPRVRRVRVGGIFSVGMNQYDQGMVLMSLAEASEFFARAGISGLRLRLDEAVNVDSAAHEIARTLGVPDSHVRPWTREHRNFFIALEDQKRMLFIVLVLIVAIAAFNIVSTLVMLVTDKRADIAILRTLGMSPAQIMMIFMVQGSMLAIVGTAGGTLLGVLFAWNIEHIVHGIEFLFGFRFLAADIYPMTDLPGEVHLADVGVIAAVSLALGLLATLYPALRAARVQPAEALRYE